MNMLLAGPSTEQCWLSGPWACDCPIIDADFVGIEHVESNRGQLDQREDDVQALERDYRQLSGCA
jgi:hypothetical protein